MLIFRGDTDKSLESLRWGKLKPGDINGARLDKLAGDALDYMKRIQELRSQIEKRVSEKSIEEIYDNLFKMLGNLFNKNSESALVKEFNDKLIKEGKVPPKYLDNLKFIIKLKNTVSEAKNSKKKSISDKQSKEVDTARRYSTEIINSLIEYSQRCEFLSIDRSRFMIRGEKLQAEVFFLQHLFVVQPTKIQKLVHEKLVDSDAKELQEQLTAFKDKEIKIDLKSLETLKKTFGEFELIY
jgi:hypothetical protein